MEFLMAVFPGNANKAYRAHQESRLQDCPEAS